MMIAIGRSAEAKRTIWKANPPRGSSVPSRFPIWLKGWHGGPPCKRAKPPAGIPNNSPVCSISRLRISTCKTLFPFALRRRVSAPWGSNSTAHIVLKPAESTPTSMPPAPENRLSARLFLAARALAMGRKIDNSYPTLQWVSPELDSFVLPSPSPPWRRTQNRLHWACCSSR